MAEPTTWQEWAQFEEWYHASTGQWPRVNLSQVTNENLRKGNIPALYLDAWNMWISQGKPTAQAYKEQLRRSKLSQPELQQEIRNKMNPDGTISWSSLQPDERAFLEQAGWTKVTSQGGFLIPEGQQVYSPPTSTQPAGGTEGADSAWVRELQALQVARERAGLTTEQWQAKLLQQQYETGGGGAQGMDMRTAMQVARANMGVGGERQPTAEQWDEMRDQILQALQASPRNWVQVAMAQRLPNPYRQTKTAGDIYEEAREEAKESSSMVLSARARLTDLIERGDASLPQIALARDLKFAAEHEADFVQEKLTKYQLARSAGKQMAQQGASLPTVLRGITDAEVRGQVESGYYATARPSPEGGMVIGRPAREEVDRGIPIPQWLQTLSGAGEFFKPEQKRQPITTPSSQMFQRLSPTQTEMFAGLVDYAGTQTYADILRQMEQQLPQPQRTPRRTAFAQRTMV